MGLRRKPPKLTAAQHPSSKGAREHHEALPSAPSAWPVEVKWLRRDHAAGAPLPDTSAEPGHQPRQLAPVLEQARPSVMVAMSSPIAHCSESPGTALDLNQALKKYNRREFT